MVFCTRRKEFCEVRQGCRPGLANVFRNKSNGRVCLDNRKAGDVPARGRTKAVQMLRANGNCPPRRQATLVLETVPAGAISDSQIVTSLLCSGIMKSLTEHL